MYRPIARVTDMRLCGATIIFSPCSLVFSDELPVAVLGSLDSHGGVATATTTTVFAYGLPIVRLGDVNDICKWVKPKHFTQPMITGDPLVSSL